MRDSGRNQAAADDGHARRHIEANERRDHLPDARFGPGDRGADEKPRQRGQEAAVRESRFHVVVGTLLLLNGPVTGVAPSPADPPHTLTDRLACQAAVDEASRNPNRCTRIDGRPAADCRGAIHRDSPAASDPNRMSRIHPSMKYESVSKLIPVPTLMGLSL